MTKTTLCMTPGPIEFEPRVLAKMAHEGVSHTDVTVIEEFAQVLEKMRKVFLAPDGQPLVVAASGTLGWDMVAANLIIPGEAALVVNTGYFGDSFGECLARYGAKVTHLRCTKVGAQPSPEDVRKVLNQTTKFKLVTITHVDTSTGVLARVAELAKVIRAAQPEALIVVDGVCATGGEECRMKDWDLDVVLTGSQKCFAVPAGLSLMVIRPRALVAFEQNTSNGGKYYTDWKHWLPIMRSYEARQASYFATPSVNHLFALNEALTILLENGGMEQRFIEQRVTGEAIQKAMRALGCGLVTVDGCHAHTLSCVRFPAGVGAADLLPRVYKRGVALAGGLHKDIKSEYFRIGHMGPSTRCVAHLVKTVQAIEDALEECGHVIPKKGEAARIVQAIQPQIETVAPPHAHCCPLRRAGLFLTPKELSIAVTALSVGVAAGAWFARGRR